jgi:hypothetical protein
MNQQSDSLLILMTCQVRGGIRARAHALYDTKRKEKPPEQPEQSAAAEISAIKARALRIAAS